MLGDTKYSKYIREGIRVCDIFYPQNYVKLNQGMGIVPIPK